MAASDVPGYIVAIVFSAREKGTQMVGEATMAARPRKEARTSTVRLSAEALRWAKIGAACKGESVPDYICRIAIECGKIDASQLNSQVSAEQKRRPKGD